MPGKIKYREAIKYQPEKHYVTVLNLQRPQGDEFPIFRSYAITLAHSDLSIFSGKPGKMGKASLLLQRRQNTFIHLPLRRP